MTTVIKNVANFLVQFRQWYENRNLLQEEVAEQLEITKWHLSKVLNQRTMPSIKLLDRMEELMNNGK